MAAAPTTSSASPYPYPSTLNISNFVSLDLNGTNYLLWRAQIRNLVESQDLGGFINGDTPPPPAVLPSPEAGTMPAPNPAFHHWKRTDRLVRAWITSRLSEEALSVVLDLETSQEVWQVLQEHYAQVSVEREFLLKQRLATLAKESSQTIHDYVRVFKTICDDLSLIGKALTDQDKVFHLLRGLGPDYNSFTTTMLRPPLPSFQSVLPQLMSYDARTIDIPKTITTAFYSQQKQRKFVPNSKQKPSRGFSSKGRGFG